MKNYIYTGKVRNNARKSHLIYSSNGIPNVNGFVEVKHIISGELFYYYEDFFKKYFKLNN
jgi:hypothetical protein